MATRLYVRGRDTPWLVEGSADQVLAKLRDVGEEPMPYVELAIANVGTRGGHPASPNVLRVNPFSVDALTEVVEK